jgi:hypothetical protein
MESVPAMKIPLKKVVSLLLTGCLWVNSGIAKGSLCPLSRPKPASLSLEWEALAARGGSFTYSAGPFAWQFSEWPRTFWKSIPFRPNQLNGLIAGLAPNSGEVADIDTTVGQETLPPEVSAPLVLMTSEEYTQAMAVLTQALKKRGLPRKQWLESKGLSSLVASSKNPVGIDTYLSFLFQGGGLKECPLLKDLYNRFFDSLRERLTDLQLKNSKWDHMLNATVDLMPQEDVKKFLSGERRDLPTPGRSTIARLLTIFKIDWERPSRTSVAQVPSAGNRKIRSSKKDKPADPIHWLRESSSEELTEFFHSTTLSYSLIRSVQKLNVPFQTWYEFQNLAESIGCPEIKNVLGKIRIVLGITLAPNPELETQEWAKKVSSQLTNLQKLVLWIAEEEQRKHRVATLEGISGRLISIVPRSDVEVVLKDFIRQGWFSAYSKLDFFRLTSIAHWLLRYNSPDAFPSVLRAVLTNA